MIADLSGYTKLSEKLGKGDGLTLLPSSSSSSSTNMSSAAANAAKKMRLDKKEMASYGSELLRQILNNYFGQLIDLIEVGGGDVIRVAGDAIIAQFIPFKESISSTCSNSSGPMGPLILKALRSAVACMNDLNDVDVVGVKLQLHIACAVGKIQTFIVGGSNDSWQYVVSGEPFKQIECALDLAKGGDIVLSPRAWSEVEDKSVWRAKHISEGNVCVSPFSVTMSKDIASQFRLDFAKVSY
jgi:class 3 adenylate cyclase